MLKIHRLYRKRKHQNKSKDQVLQPNGSSVSRMEEDNKLQWRLLFSGMSRIRLLVPKLKCAACCAFYLIAPCFLWGVKGETTCSARNLLGWRDPCTLQVILYQSLCCGYWLYLDFLNGSEYPKMKSKVIRHKLACNLIQKHYNNTIGKIFEHKR